MADFLAILEYQNILERYHQTHHIGTSKRHVFNPTSEFAVLALCCLVLITKGYHHLGQGTPKKITCVLQWTQKPRIFRPWKLHLLGMIKLIQTLCKEGFLPCKYLGILKQLPLDLSEILVSKASKFGNSSQTKICMRFAMERSTDKLPVVFQEGIPGPQLFIPWQFYAVLQPYFWITSFRPWSPL